MGELRQMTRDEIIMARLPFLRKFARKLAANEPEDLVHDTVCRALQRWHLCRFDPGSQAWLGTMMSRVASNQRRDRKACEPLDEFYCAVTRPNQFARVYLREVGEVLDGLPQIHQEVMRTVCIDGLSYAEAAEELGIPIGTVMSRLYRAREHLARLQ